MMRFCEFTFLLLPWLTHCMEGPEFFRPSSFITHSGPARNYVHERRHFAPSFTSDLASEETRVSEAPRRPSSKKVPFSSFDWNDDDFSRERLPSAEFSNEFNAAFDSKDKDDRDYTIGTQIRVQHPVPRPKKSTSPHSKPTKSSNHGVFKSSSHREKETLTHPASASSVKSRANKYIQLYESLDPIKPAPPPKSPASGYNVYEPDQEHFQLLSRPKPSSHSLDPFKGVASDKQIEKYLEDQQKLLDEALKIQLLKDPRFQQYVQSKGREQLNSEQYGSEELQYSAPPLPSNREFKGNSVLNGNNSRRRPQTSEFKLPPKGKPHAKGQGKPVPRRFRSAIVINV